MEGDEGRRKKSPDAVFFGERHSTLLNKFELLAIEVQIKHAILLRRSFSEPSPALPAARAREPELREAEAQPRPKKIAGEVRRIARAMKSFVGWVVVGDKSERASSREWKGSQSPAECFATWYASCPGLKVLIPYSPKDARDLLKAAIRDHDPIVFLENELLYVAHKCLNKLSKVLA